MAGLGTRAIGATYSRLEGREKVTGAAKYAFEHDVEGAVYASPVAATIAVGRHVILIDLEHAGGMQLIGVAALVLALTTGCYLTKRSFRENG